MNKIDKNTDTLVYEHINNSLDINLNDYLSFLDEFKYLLDSDIKRDIFIYRNINLNLSEDEKIMVYSKIINITTDINRNIVYIIFFMLKKINICFFCFLPEKETIIFNIVMYI
ncbi:hypothetical protein SLOPH_2381 [Spraguea lophii 42_110]|uniref:Uncharacterized protein n=1 Tax=Spraguea lophii (strain 42_110) TaxID=1358809 RepID=S7WAA3_SPRLO|nr:hypothetical protein SLOPH_2381 [Spraguea lophii 42_110]